MKIRQFLVQICPVVMFKTSNYALGCKLQLVQMVETKEAVNSSPLLRQTVDRYLPTKRRESAEGSRFLAVTNEVERDVKVEDVLHRNLSKLRRLHHCSNN